VSSDSVCYVLGVSDTFSCSWQPSLCLTPSPLPPPSPHHPVSPQRRPHPKRQRSARRRGVKRRRSRPLWAKQRWMTSRTSSRPSRQRTGPHTPPPSAHHPLFYSSRPRAISQRAALIRSECAAGGRALLGLARGVVVLCVSDRQGWRVGSTGHGSEEFRLLKEARDLEDCLYS
jgi:hypothetical protein